MKNLTIANTEMPLKFFDDKASRLDIKITLKDGKKSILKCKICGSTITPKELFIIGLSFIPKTLNEAMVTLI